MRDYFIFRRAESKWGPSSMSHAKRALGYFFVDQLRVGTQWTVFREVRIIARPSLPVVLSREAVARVLRRRRATMWRRVCARVGPIPGIHSLTLAAQE